MNAKRLILVFNSSAILVFLFLLVFSKITAERFVNEFIIFLSVVATIFLPFLSAVLAVAYWKDLSTGIRTFGIIPLLVVLLLLCWISWNIRNMED